MDPRLRIVIAALVLLAVGVAVTSWWGSDERRIERRLGELMDSIDKSAGEAQLAGALRSEEAVRSFAEPFRFRARQFDFETDNRQSMIRAIILYRSRSERIDTNVLDSEYEVTPAAGRATMLLTARFQGGWQGVTGDAYRFRLDWIEQEGQWRIAGADLLEIVTPGLGG